MDVDAGMSDLILPSRRRFLLGAGALLAAPAIVRVASIMPVSVVAAPDSLIAVDITVVLAQYDCLYGFTDKTFLCHDNIARDIVA